MSRRVSYTHLSFLLFVTVAAIFLNGSAINASTRLYNLIVVLPSGALCLLFVFLIALSERRKPTDVLSESALKAKRKATLGDIVLLGVFALFCLSLTTLGFDIATFAFVWLGILMGGEKRWLAPPVFSFLFTLALIKGFGSLFPFPMPLMVF